MFLAQSIRASGLLSPHRPPSEWGGLTPAEDPRIVGWAQSCLGKIIGGWVPQDGVLGPATRRAIAMFQKGAQVPPSGTLDDSTLSALQQACQQSAQPDASGITGASPPEAPSMPTHDMSVVVPPPGAPSTPTAPEQRKEFEWESEWEDRPSGPQPPRAPQRRSCEPDRCTSPYIRWLQSSLNSVAEANIKVTGMMDDPTMAAVNRFRISRKLNANESYHSTSIQPRSTSRGMSVGGRLAPRVDQEPARLPDRCSAPLSCTAVAKASTMGRESMRR